MTHNAPDDDEDLRRLVRSADPLAGRPPALLTVTGAQLRGRAARRRRGRRVAGALASATAAVAILAAVLVHIGGPQPPGPPAAPPADPAPLAVQHPDGDRPGRAALRELAGRAAARPDTTPRAGAVTHTTVLAWTRGGAEQEIQAWWRPDRAARSVVSGAAPETRTFAPGEYPVAVPDPAATPEALAGQLNHYLEQSRARNLAHAVADMNRYHCLTPAQRAAALHVLADTDGVMLRGAATDRRGRTGLAVSMDDPADGVRHLLVFDPDTGALLSYEQIVAVGPSTSPVRAPAMLSYVVYLACEQTADMP